MADKYDPIRLVGKGSFGSVYLVSRRRDGAQFVLKNMQIKNVPDKEIESYQNEVRLLSELEHPGIVSHVESFIDADKQHMCIVMGYAEGGDLAAYLKHKKGIPMREAEVLYHFVQMALALLYMHEKNILHRDLKTQNIFIKNGLIQLGDFGISKALTGSNDFAQTCIGTPYYMSPELFQNKPYNFKSDTWALGCVLYEMMTYKHAFDATSINGLAQKILKGQIAALPATYPKAMRLLVKQMLDLEPKNRPTMRQILDMGFLRKHIKTYVTAVMMNEQNYRPQDISNFRAQLKRISMADLLDNQVPAVITPVVGQANAAIPALGLAGAKVDAAGDSKASARPSARNGADRPVSAAGAANVAQSSSSSSSASAAAAAQQREREKEKEREREKEKEREKERLAAERAAAAAARHKEQQSKLAQIAKEEAERKALEEKLSKVKSEHEAKIKRAAELRSQKAAAAAASGSSSSRPSSALTSARGSTPNTATPGGGSSSSASRLKPSGSAAKLPSAATPSPVTVANAAAASKKPSSASGKRPPSASASRQAADERARRLEKEKQEHEQALRQREIEELRAAEAARLAEAERIDARRKQIELARKKKQESEQAAVVLREREMEKARADEVARQRRVYAAQAETEKAEIERIQLEKQWISKRLDDLASKPVPARKPSTAPTGSGARNLRDDEYASDDSSMSAKDKILAEKAAKKQAAQEAEKAKLLEGRKEAFVDRLNVASKTKPIVGSPVVPPHLQSSLSSKGVVPPSSSPPQSYHPPSSSARGGHPQLQKQDSEQYDDEEFETDSSPAPVASSSHAHPSSHASQQHTSMEEVEEEVVEEEDLEQEAQEIEEAEGLLLGLTKRLQDLRTSIQVPAQYELAEELEGGDPEEEELLMPEEEDESETEEETTSSATTQRGGAGGSGAAKTDTSRTPVIAENMLNRMKALAKESAKLVGRARFIEAFEYLKNHLSEPRQTKIAQLTKILGEKKVEHWEMIEQLVFMEKNNS